MIDCSHFLKIKKTFRKTLKSCSTRPCTGILYLLLNIVFHSFFLHIIASVVNGRLCYSCSYIENEIKKDYECVTSPANVTTAKTVSCPDDGYCFTQTQYHRGNDHKTIEWGITKFFLKTGGTKEMKITSDFYFATKLRWLDRKSTNFPSDLP